MTRINTNVSSLNAQKTLARSNAQLQEALARLSTGLRINTGKDDPAGLIASELLRSDIVNTQKAISNAERANQMIATADGALGQVNSLLNDVRALVTEAANKGALSDEQIAANQLQIDSSLEALNRIAQTTTFQGRKLLDGSLDFITTAGAGYSTKVSGHQIEQATIGSSGTVAVSGAITTAATQAQITTTVGAGAVAASGVVTFADADYMTVTAAATGSSINGTTIAFVETASVAAGTPFAEYDSVAKTIKVYVNNANPTTMANINSAIDGLADFTSVYTQNGAADTNYTPGGEAPAVATMGGGLNAGGGLAASVVFQLSGAKGTQVFNFGAGTLGGDIANAINLVSDATGVTATFGGSTLTMKAADYGSKGFVDVSVISEGGGAFASGLSATRASGVNAVATINGVAATADGNEISIATATLSMKTTLIAAQTGAFALTITGGGALFQLGPEVVANQQLRMGVQSVDTGHLGGNSGRLYQLVTGGSASLATDPTTAAKIVDEVITKVASLRGRLGAFQKTTLDANIASLNDTLENLTNAESSIRDADFAKETARLTRAQILVQSGTSVLALANQSPQNVLALLRS